MDTASRSGRSFHRFGILGWIAVLLLAVAPVAQAQSVSNLERGRGRDMLRTIKDDIKKHYYDPDFHGMDLDARFAAADEKMKSATSLGHIFGIIAQTLLDLDDSHTFFLPPPRAVRVRYGWLMKNVGERCFVSAVRPDSDAEKKGLKPGDEIYSVDGLNPSRENLWKLLYLFRTLRPKPTLRVVVLRPNGSQRVLDIEAEVENKRHLTDLNRGEDLWELVRESETQSKLNRDRLLTVGDGVTIWKMPEFDLDDGEIDGRMREIAESKALILDLRGNPGGLEDTLVRLTGWFFDHDIQMGDVKGRKEQKPVVAQGRGDHAFKGRLVVLVDSESASAAELFARVVQLEKRGTVMGDRTAGAVMRSRIFSHQIGQSQVTFYAASVTDSDIIMADGKSLEKVGVTPDEIVLPTAQDLAAQRDPVLSRAAALLGVELDPAKAGTFFPHEWPK